MDSPGALSAAIANPEVRSEKEAGSHLGISSIIRTRARRARCPDHHHQEKFRKAMARCPNRISWCLQQAALTASQRQCPRACRVFEHLQALTAQSDAAIKTGSATCSQFSNLRPTIRHQRLQRRWNPVRRPPARNHIPTCICRAVPKRLRLPSRTALPTAAPAVFAIACGVLRSIDVNMRRDGHRSGDATRAQPADPTEPLVNDDAPAKAAEQLR